MDSCRGQANVRHTTSGLQVLTCYLKPRKSVSPRFHLLQVDKCQDVEICHVLLLDEFVYFKASPERPVDVYYSRGQSILVSLLEAFDVHSHGA
jgi:hypothetical protein